MFFLLVLAGMLGVSARLNEYVPIIKPALYEIQHAVNTESLPNSFTWSNVNNVNYLNLGQSHHIYYQLLP